MRNQFQKFPRIFTCFSAKVDSEIGSSYNLKVLVNVRKCVHTLSGKLRNYPMINECLPEGPRGKLFLVSDNQSKIILN